MLVKRSITFYILIRAWSETRMKSASEIISVETTRKFSSFVHELFCIKYATNYIFCFFFFFCFFRFFRSSSEPSQRELWESQRQRRDKSCWNDISNEYPLLNREKHRKKKRKRIFYSYQKLIHNTTGRTFEFNRQKFIQFNKWSLTVFYQIAQIL